MIGKPKFGDKCNGCGVCCIIEPCLLANEALDCYEGPCAALEQQEDGSYACGLVKRPAWYMFNEDVPSEQTKDISEFFATALGIGKGCDASDEGIPSYFKLHRA
jgi:hypothetical protein